MSIFERINRLFPVWAILLAVIAAFAPEFFTGLAGYIKTLLVIIMFAMGLTLTKDDFVRVVKTPKPIAVGVLLQFLVMPLAALLVSRVLGLSPELTIGMVLVGATAGGTSSNVIPGSSGVRYASPVGRTRLATS